MLRWSLIYVYNRKVEKQKFSEACRPLLGDKVDLDRENHRLDCHLRVNRGTATTFSLTPLLS